MRALGSRPRGLVVAALLSLAASARALEAHLAADQEEDRLPPGHEGPLQNDAFLPTDAAIEADLARGDAAFARAREARGARDAERHYATCFEAWNDALERLTAAPRASVWRAPEGAAERRLTEGARVALGRRLGALDEGERKRWRGRFGATAERALAGAGRDADALRIVELRYPGTAAAARSALALADRALESGRTEAASGWLDRGATALGIPGTGASGERPAEVELEGSGEALAAALAARRPLAVTPGGLAGGGDAWRTASALEAVAYEELIAGLPVSADLDFGAGIRPGLAFLPDGHIAVQTPTHVQLFRLGADGSLAPAGAFQPARVVAEYGSPLHAFAERRPPGWRLRPAVAGRDLVLVHGRTVREGEPNALLCVRPPEPADPLSALGEEAFPRLRWALLGSERVVAGQGPGAPARVETVTELAELVDLELQPGPIVTDELVLVQARSYGNAVSAWLLAFERRTGALAWHLLLASGSDLVPDARLHTGWGTPRLAAAPLAHRAGSVFASTHLGAGALVETLDGRPLWSLKNRRRSLDTPGWPGGAPWWGADDSLLWAPFDSDRLYLLRGGALGAGAGVESVFRAAPRATGEAIALLGGTGPEVLTLGRAGRDHTVSAWKGPGTPRVDALYLGRDEDFAGDGLVSETRVLTCTDRGLYLFDRTRDLYLVDYAALFGGDEGARGGDLYGRGAVVVALGPRGVWTFRTRESPPRGDGGPSHEED